MKAGNENETLNERFATLTEEDLRQVFGGTDEDGHSDSFKSWMEKLDRMEANLPKATAQERRLIHERLEELMNYPASFWENMTEDEYRTIKGRLHDIRVR